MKTKIAVFTALVVGLQATAFASPKSRMASPPKLPGARVVVNVIDGVEMTRGMLEAVIDNIKSNGKEKELKPRPGVRARLIASTEYALRPFSVKLPPLDGASLRLREPKTVNSRVLLSVMSINQGPTQTDVLLNTTVSQEVGRTPRTKLAFTATISPNRRAANFGEVLATTPTDALVNRLPTDSNYSQMLVGFVRKVLNESLRVASRAVRR